MKRRRDYWYEPVNEFDILALFGEAKIVRDLRGRFHIHGGTDEDRKQAHDYMLQFMWPADKPKPARWPGIII